MPKIDYIHIHQKKQNECIKTNFPLCVLFFLSLIQTLLIFSPINPLIVNRLNEKKMKEIFSSLTHIFNPINRPLCVKEHKSVKNVITYQLKLVKACKITVTGVVGVVGSSMIVIHIFSFTFFPQNFLHTISCLPACCCVSSFFLLLLAHNLTLTSFFFG